MWSSLSHPLSLVTAVIIAVMSAYATLAGSHRRFRADVLSTNRQRWIDGFRDRLAELLSVMTAAQVIKRTSVVGRWRGGAGPVTDNPALAEKLEKTFLAIAQIRLMTRAAEPQHCALNRAIAAAVEYIQADELHEAELSACWEEIVELGRGIIRQEWGRVKRGV